MILDVAFLFLLFTVIKDSLFKWKRPVSIIECDLGFDQSNDGHV